MSAALLKKMREMGLSFDQAIELLETMEEQAPKVPGPSKAALRQRAYRERQAAEASRNVTRDATSNDNEGDGEALSLPLPPQTPQTPTHTREEKSIRARASKRVPAAWSPSSSVLEFAAAEGFTAGEIERELATMRDHTFGTARTDWDATFRNWLRRKTPSTRPVNHPGQRPHHGRPDPSQDRQSRFLDRLSDIDRAMEQAVQQPTGRTGA